MPAPRDAATKVRKIPLVPAQDTSTDIYQNSRAESAPGLSTPDGPNDPLQPPPPADEQKKDEKGGPDKRKPLVLIAILVGVGIIPRLRARPKLR